MCSSLFISLTVSFFWTFSDYFPLNFKYYPFMCLSLSLLIGYPLSLFSILLFSQTPPTQILPSFGFQVHLSLSLSLQPTLAERRWTLSSSKNSFLLKINESPSETNPLVNLFLKLWLRRVSWVRQVELAKLYPRFKLLNLCSISILCFSL